MFFLIRKKQWEQKQMHNLPGTTHVSIFGIQQLYFRQFWFMPICVAGGFLFLCVLQDAHEVDDGVLRWQDVRLWIVASTVACINRCHNVSTVVTLYPRIKRCIPSALVDGYYWLFHASEVRRDWDSLLIYFLFVLFAASMQSRWLSTIYIEQHSWRIYLCVCVWYNRYLYKYKLTHMYVYIYMHPYTDINNIELWDLKRLDKVDICLHDPWSVPGLAWFNSEGSGLHNLTTELASQRNAAMLWHGVSNSIRARWFCDQWTWSVWDGHPWRSVQCPRFQGVYGFCVFRF